MRVRVWPVEKTRATGAGGKTRKHRGSRTAFQNVYCVFKKLSRNSSRPVVCYKQTLFFFFSNTKREKLKNSVRVFFVAYGSYISRTLFRKSSVGTSLNIHRTGFLVSFAMFIVLNDHVRRYIIIYRAHRHKRKKLRFLSQCAAPDRESSKREIKLM